MITRAADSYTFELQIWLQPISSRPFKYVQIALYSRLIDLGSNNLKSTVWFVQKKFGQFNFIVIYLQQYS
jgi:hypothetical protein